MGALKLGYFVLAASILATSLYHGDYFNAMLAVCAGFVVAQA